MQNINFKRGTVLSVFVTIFVMIALISAGLILLLKNEVILLNPQYFTQVEDNQQDIENQEQGQQSNTQVYDLTKYEGIIKGTNFKQLIQEINAQKLTDIVIYISDNYYNQQEATKELANVIMMTNAKLTNTTEYTQIVDNGDYMAIMEKNDDKVVEKIYVIKINNNI